MYHSININAAPVAVLAALHPATGIGANLGPNSQEDS